MRTKKRHGGQVTDSTEYGAGEELTQGQGLPRNKSQTRRS
jgi:hypothetical protein